MRIFTPTASLQAHWHGHLGANFLTDTNMIYQIDDQEIIFPDGRLVVFRAAIPYHLTRITPEPDALPGIPARLANICLPLDARELHPNGTALILARGPPTARAVRNGTARP